MTGHQPQDHLLTCLAWANQHPLSPAKAPVKQRTGVCEHVRVVVHGRCGQEMCLTDAHLQWLMLRVFLYCELVARSKCVL